MVFCFFIGSDRCNYPKAAIVMNRIDNLKLLDEFVESLALKRHMFAVEAAVRAYAKKFDEDGIGNRKGNRSGTRKRRSAISKLDSDRCCLYNAFSQFSQVYFFVYFFHDPKTLTGIG
jgi:hypothetical protein